MIASSDRWRRKSLAVDSRDELPLLPLRPLRDTVHIRNPAKKLPPLLSEVYIKRIAPYAIALPPSDHAG